MFLIEKQIADKMQSLGVAASFVCALSNVSPTMFSAAMRNLKQFENQTAVRILDLLADLTDLVDLARPIPVALENPQVIRGLLNDLRQAKIRSAPADASGVCALCALKAAGERSINAGTFSQQQS